MYSKSKNMRYFFLSLLFIGFQTMAQDASRFDEEVEAIQRKYDTLWDSSNETIVFTGSSSVRIWKDLESRFPEHQIVNSGFGGSQASDLLHHIDQLVLRFKPKKVFIYEGDNDISVEKKPKAIIHDMKEIIALIGKENTNTKVVLIAAKPSIARWELKKHYKKLNRKFKKLSKKNPLLEFADVWKPMLDKKNVKQDIFIEDGLHMNAKGYHIWYDVIKDFMEPMKQGRRLRPKKIPKSETQY